MYDAWCMTDLTELGTVLTVWAHPDDETYLASGLLAALADAGHRVVCVTATRGEAADPDATPDERAALAEVRTRELAAALALLGVTEHHWLDHPDGCLADADADADTDPLVEPLWWVEGGGCRHGKAHPGLVLAFVAALAARRRVFAVRRHAWVV